MILPSDTFGPDDAPHEAWILHGILGSRRNWRAFARTVAPTLPGWRLRTLDLRCHGDAVNAVGPHSVAVCAQDLVDTAASLGRGPTVAVGHSFGGKVVLALAGAAPAGLRSVCVLDAVPGPDAVRALGDGGDEDVVRLIGALDDVPLPVDTYVALEAHLRGLGFSPTVSSWMTTNLRPGPAGGLVWRFDLDGVRALLLDYAAWDAWPTVASTPVGVHLLRATRSARWTPAVLARAAEIVDGERVTLDPIEAGHWVHADAPRQLADWLKSRLELDSVGKIT